MLHQIGITTILFTVASASPSLLSRASSPAPISVGIPASPPANVSQLLDPYLISFSIEPAFLNEFLGNKTTPNKLGLSLFNTLASKTGGIGVRPGGNTVDSSIYDPTLVGDQQLVLSPSAAVWQTRYGPSYFDSLNLLPDSTKITMDINLRNASYELSKAQVAAAQQILGSKLDAVEIGNEPDFYGRQTYRNASTWSPEAYAAQFVEWSHNLTSDLNLPKNFFWPGGYATHPDTTNFTTANTIALGINNASTVKIYSDHWYPYDSCSPEHVAQASYDHLVNHTQITDFINSYKGEIAASKAVGMDFLVGESSSIACSGLQNVSNTYGQALWMADTYLYAASINVTRIYTHQGATLISQSSNQINTPGYSWYDFFYPSTTARNGPSQANPSFHGLLLVADAMGNAKTSRLVSFPVASQPTLAIYAIWDSSARTGAPARAVILNLGAKNDLSVDLSSLSPTGVKRLHAPTRNATDSKTVTYAGQSWADGTGSGTLTIEKPLADGSVAVGAYEAVLVYLAGVNGTVAGTPVGTASGSSPTKASSAGRTATFAAGGAWVAFVGAALSLL
ncbi:glycoside hydrolase family 79 protein [Laccaria bicolor S238N-H82]|uniref:Glycoside hydrolase family 79 protein n=1 Tax=Laccaria bicolor (strain S238N-H82 / ATCC MYA-4686) TaxID=486041 RepID=B0E426_LACBS|nr:glycoside hydrolase family 79 protein [Laccaria bicolor S238N-H82]EDQ98404.1 glycoside hydrolase family 79 protein [Laccaria bicolor S238N-H82]|eukprot:XP_001890944.1 glycoside hydrolase family 79 protein [Laccaria bicolor S238N-H82]